MRMGLVGYQGSGKSTLFEWLTGVRADPALAHASQSAMAAISDARLESLAHVYQPKKITPAVCELVDTAGLSRTHEGSAGRLAQIRETGCLVLVAGAHAPDADALADVDSFADDFLLADLEIVSRRIERLRESLKKHRPDRDAELAELAALETLLAALESGKPPSASELNERQLKATRSFGLLSQKPKFVVFNLPDDQSEAPALVDELASRDPPVRAAAVPARLELELSQMDALEREAFRREMGIGSFDREALLAKMLDAAGQILFFTAGEKEVRAWVLPRGATALDAAGGIHSDLARGFIRAEVTRSEDLVLAGSEREAKAQGFVRQEGKEYVVQDGDVLLIRFSV